MGCLWFPVQQANRGSTILRSLTHLSYLWAPEEPLPLAFPKSTRQGVGSLAGSAGPFYAFVGEGSPTKIDYRKKKYSYSNLSDLVWKRGDGHVPGIDTQTGGGVHAASSHTTQAAFCGVKRGS